MRWYNDPMFNVTEGESQKQGHFVAGSLKLIFGFFIIGLWGVVLGFAFSGKDFILGFFVFGLFLDIIAIYFLISGIKNFIVIWKINKEKKK